MRRKLNNIELHYLYRDAGNFKRRGMVIFWNPKNLPVDQVVTQLQSRLILEQYFIHTDWKLPPLFFDSYDSELDHSWHELDSVKVTACPSSEIRTIDQFLSELGCETHNACSM
ncbi:MAG: hypothetical protein OCD76_09085 [Reichenbachiella sp.]